MNIVKLQNDLKDLSDQQLYQTMQGGSAPHYLVLGEMQRRKSMRQESSSKPQAPTSVADEIMSGIAANPTPNMQQMPNGGVASFAGGGYLKGSAEACWKNPETGQQECPSAKGDVRKSKLSAPKFNEDDGLMDLLKKITKSETGKEETTQKFADRGLVDPDLANMTDEEIRELAQLHVESNNRQEDDEGNTITSPKGALGKWQVMPPTAMDPGYKMKNIFDLHREIYGEGEEFEGTVEEAAELLKNRKLNEAMGKEYKRGLTEMFGEEGALPAYNMGPGAYKKYLAGQQGMPQETKDYVAKTEKKAAELRQQSGRDGIAALGESRGSYGPGETAATKKYVEPAEVKESVKSIPEGGDEYGEDIADPGAPAKADAAVQWVKDNPAEAALYGLTLTPAGGLLLNGIKVGAKLLPKVGGIIQKAVNSAKIAAGKKPPAGAKAPGGNKLLGPRTGKGKAYKNKEYAETAKKEIEASTGAAHKVVKEGDGFVVVPTAGNIAKNVGVPVATAAGVAGVAASQLPESQKSEEPDPEFDEGDTGPVAKGEGIESVLPKKGETAKAAQPSGVEKLGAKGFKINKPGTQTPAPQTPAATAGTPTTTTTATGNRGDYIDELRARLTNLDEKDNFNRALMMAGLGMMTSKRTDFLGAAGEGGIAGLTALNAADRADQAAMLDLLEREQKVLSGKSGGADFGDMVALMKLRQDIKAEVEKRFSDTTARNTETGKIVDALKQQPEYQGKSAGELKEIADQMYKKRLWDEVKQSQDYSFLGLMPQFAGALDRQ